MIYLTKGQPLFDNSSMVVCDQTGYYEDGSPVICAAAYDPENPVCRYEAKFIAYGNAVYNITDPDLLMKQVIEIDPKSLFGKSNNDVTLDKAVENIQTIDSVQTQTPTIANTTEAITNPEELSDALSTSTPVTSDTAPIIPAVEPEIPVEVPVEVVPLDISTSTPITVTENISTTTPLTDITF